MAIIKDLKELPKDEPKLQKYSVYSLLLCLIVSIGMALWYFIRLQKSGANPSEPSWFWSSIHLGGYIAYAVVTALGLFGAYYPKPQFMCWYLIGTLAVLIAEVVCIVYNQVVVSDQNRKFSIVTIILKVAALLVFLICGVLAFLWKRYLDKNKSVQTLTKPGEAKDESKSGSAKPDKKKTKV